MTFEPVGPNPRVSWHRDDMKVDVAVGKWEVRKQAEKCPIGNTAAFSAGWCVGSKELLCVGSL
jgi:hypothetical protein